MEQSTTRVLRRFCHDHCGFRVLLYKDWQAADVIKVRVAHKNGIKAARFYAIKKRERIQPGVLGVGASIENDARVAELEKVGIGTNIRVSSQILKTHIGKD